MPTTARFEIERRRHLISLFNKDRMIRLWRDLVKEQIRLFEIKDLHDYYDFNYSIEAHVTLIIDRVLAGQYRSDIPLVYRLEKKLGVCRHILIPTPSDVLVFQVLTDAIYKAIIKAQPSKCAYYARDRHHLKLPHELKCESTYPWFRLWPKYQKDIWNFSKSHKYIVTTDVLNYFDNISLRELRNTLSATVKTKEVYLDLLFSLIESLSWNPDYLPTSLKGLPMINIEAPRLLAHALLFEVDRVLKQKTNKCFVRWMDDINFGVDDFKTAKQTLNEINDVLKSRGLALNLAKTNILSSKEAEYHFLFRENVLLDKYEKTAKRLKNKLPRLKQARKIVDELKIHLKICKARNKDKLTKRYLNILSKLKVPILFKELTNIFTNEPDQRVVILLYLSKLPFSVRLAKIFIDLLDKTDIYDDVTKFSIIDAIVRLKVPRTKIGKRFISEIKIRLRNPKKSFDWYCYTYFLVKYGEPKEVYVSVNIGKKYSIESPFFARQRMAALPRCIKLEKDTAIDIWNHEINSCSFDSASVASNYVALMDKAFPSKNDRLYYYLFPKQKQESYPLSKFLILCILANNEVSQNLKLKHKEINEYIIDDWYRYWLKTINPHWFK